jgi:hypothetical protein
MRICVLAVVVVVAVVGASLASASSTPTNIAPQIAARAACVATIQGYTQGAQGYLEGVARDVAQTYANAAQANTAIDQGIHNMLAASNPNITQQTQLESLGVDPTTRAQIAAQNTQGYDTTGSVMAALGNLNADSLAAQGAAEKSYVQSLPGLIAASGQQALARCQGATAPPYSTPSYGSSSSSYYGQPNGAGFPKNQYVPGYITKSGKYVSGYWRNSPTDGYPTCKVIHC